MNRTEQRLKRERDERVNLLVCLAEPTKNLNKQTAFAVASLISKCDRERERVRDEAKSAERFTLVCA